VPVLEQYKQCDRSYLNAFPDLHLPWNINSQGERSWFLAGRRPEPIWAMGKEFLQPDDGLS
jgi:hypothetical protein